MSLEIPSNIKRDIQKFAQEQHISPDEAVLRLLETGLSVSKPAARTEAFQPAFDKERARAAGARIRELRNGVKLELHGMSIRELAHIGHKY